MILQVSLQTLKICDTQKFVHLNLRKWFGSMHVY